MPLSSAMRKRYAFAKTGVKKVAKWTVKRILGNPATKGSISNFLMQSRDLIDRKYNK